MAEDTQKPAAAEEVAVEKPVAEKEKEQAPAPVPEPEAPGKPTEESAAAGVEEVAEPEKPKPVEEAKIAQSASFKEESNVVGELPDPQKKALDELKQLIQDALNKHEFTAPPPPPPPPAAKEEEKAPEAPPKEKEEAAAAAEEQVVKAEEPKTGEEEKKPAVEVESKAPESEPAAPAEVEVVVEKVATVDEDGAKTVEAIEETIVAAKPEVEEAEVTTTKKEAEVAAPSDEQTKDKEAEVPPEKVFIWGIPLLGDDRSDTILLKFLRARDFKVKDAFTMIKNTVRWRNEFGIDAVLEEDLGNDLDKVVFMHGVDKEGHPVCYNVFGEFQNKELYHNNFSDDEKRTKFLKWRIQFLEKSIRKLDFSPSGICTIVQINDLKNSPGPAKRDLRIATNQAVHLLQDNYPEFVARQVFINVPWWYLAFNRMISPFLTQRTKSKFVFSGPSKSAETLFKYIAPEQVSVQYGGLSREGEQEFTTTDPVTEVVVKPASKYTVEIPVSERSILVWELRVLGWDVSYGAEFVPSAEGSYTVIVSKTRKVTPTDEPVICDTFKIGEPGKVVLTIDNQSSKKKKLLYRSKTKPSSD